MPYNETEQRALLAHHQAQLTGIQQSIAGIEAGKADGSIDAAVADERIAWWQQHADLQRKHIADCERNLMPEGATEVEPVIDSVLVVPEGLSPITLTAQPADGESITTDSGTFTFKSALTGEPGEILIGATLSETAEHLLAAMTPKPADEPAPRKRGKAQ